MQHKKKPPGDEPGAGNDALATHPPNSKTQSRTQDSKPETLRKLLIGDLRKLCRHAFGSTLPDNEKGRDALDLLLRLHAVAPVAAEKKMRHEIEIFAPWMPKSEFAPIIDSLLSCDPRRVRPSREEIQHRVNLTNAQRERLEVWRIPPVDMTPEALAEQRKAKKKARQAERRRQSGAVPRQQHVTNSISTRKPWIAEGISRRTWYRRNAQV